MRCCSLWTRPTTAGLPVLVDYAFDGTQANAGICGGLTNCQSGGLGLTLQTSGPSVSTTGEFVAFASVSSNLIKNQVSGGSQIFVRDTCLGADVHAEHVHRERGRGRELGEWAQFGTVG